MNSEPVVIQSAQLDEALHQRIYAGFSEHALAETGSDGSMHSMSFCAYQGKKWLGAVTCKTFWGGLHIKYLYLLPEARNEGIGKRLLKTAIEAGKRHHCRFAYVETMNFQALQFYQSLGFVEEFARTGFDKNTSFHYLRLDFSPSNSVKEPPETSQ